MKRIVFLDIDGVLNDTRFPHSAGKASGSRVIAPGEWKPEDHLDPARIARLDTLLVATRAEVVISSSWRNAYKRPKLVALLESRGFKGRVIGQTPWLPGHERHVEIKRWLSQQVPEVERFVILDDDQDAGVGFGHRYVFVPDGLEDEHVERARRVLE